MKFYLILATIAILLSSCMKQSIADAMLNESGQNTITATLRYEINGTPVSVSVSDADHHNPNNRILSCEKSGVYIFSGLIGSGDFVFTFFTDSLQATTYKYTSNYGPMYVTTFEGRPQYVYGPADNMSFTVTSYKDRHISGTFSGQLTPVVLPGYPNNVYGTLGSVLIKNGSFTNVPVFY